MDVLYYMEDCPLCEAVAADHPGADLVPLDELDTWGDKMYRVGLRAQLEDIGYNGTAPLLVVDGVVRII